MSLESKVLALRDALLAHGRPQVATINTDRPPAWRRRIAENPPAAVLKFVKHYKTLCNVREELERQTNGFSARADGVDYSKLNALLDATGREAWRGALALHTRNPMTQSANMGAEVIRVGIDRKLLLAAIDALEAAVAEAIDGLLALSASLVADYGISLALNESLIRQFLNDFYSLHGAREYLAKESASFGNTNAMNAATTITSFFNA